MKSPYQHWLKQYKERQEVVDEFSKEIERYQPLIGELKKRQARIYDKYGINEAVVRYGSGSPEYQLARERARDELDSVRQEIGKVENDIHVYSMRQRQAQMQLNIVNDKLGEMENDPHMAPLLEPIKLQGGKETYLYNEEIRLLDPIMTARYQAEMFERAASGVSSPVPSKSVLGVPQTSAREEREQVRHLQSNVKEHDPSNQ